MPTYPILDRVGAPILIGLLLVLLLFERRWPLRGRVDRWLHRVVTNMVVATPSFVVLRLPLRFERVLSWFIMTPRAHGIHHSIVARETNSNFSNFLIVWDRLHRTLRLNVPQRDIVVGVPDYRDARELGAIALLLMPFRRQRQSTAADGLERATDARARSAKPTDRLAG